jgi:hypothetical protein
VSVIAEHLLSAIIGGLLVYAGCFAKGRAYGLTGRLSPIDPLTTAQRVVFFIFGAIFLGVSLAGWVLGRQILH